MDTQKPLSLKRTRDGEEQFTVRKRFSFTSSSTRLQSLLTHHHSLLGLQPLSPPMPIKKPLQDLQKFTEEVKEESTKVIKHPLVFEKKYYNVLSAEKLKKQRVKYGKDLFSLLPDEMVLRVCGFLDKISLSRFAQTCTRLQHLSSDSTLWTKIDTACKTVSTLQLTKLLIKKPVLLRMSSTTVKGMSVAIPIQQLTHLDLTMANIETKVLKSIIRNSQQLTHLSLEHLSVEGVVKLLSKKLRVLNLSLCYEVNCDELVYFLERNTELVELNLSGIKCTWSEEDLFKVIGAFKDTLQMLNLAGFRDILNDDHTAIIPITTPHLIDLDLSDCQKLTQRTIKSILRLNNIQHLSFSRCYGIQPASYGLLTSLQHLRQLEIFSLFKENSVKSLKTVLGGKVGINLGVFSRIARPTFGGRRSSIWGLRVRD